MTMNPSDYDPDELREGNELHEDEFLGQPGMLGSGQAGPAGAEDVLRSNQYRELFLLERATGEHDLQKPYLSELPTSYAAEIIIFEWLEFLVDQTGFRRTLDVLRYYRSIEWLTEETEDRLQEYLQSFDGGGSEGGLDRSDHLLSLVYIARLASMD